MMHHSNRKFHRTCFNTSAYSVCQRPDTIWTGWLPRRTGSASSSSMRLAFQWIWQTTTHENLKIITPIKRITYVYSRNGRYDDEWEQVDAREIIQEEGRCDGLDATCARVCVCWVGLDASVSLLTNTRLDTSNPLSHVLRNYNIHPSGPHVRVSFLPRRTHTHTSLKKVRSSLLFIRSPKQTCALWKERVATFYGFLRDAPLIYRLIPLFYVP